MPINHSLSATTPDNPAYEIKPSNWNANHVVSFVGSEILPAFNNSPSVTFGLDGGGLITASAAGGGGAGNLAVSAGTTSNTQTGITFSNSNGVSFGLNAGTITASYSNQTEGYYAIGNTTLSSSGTMDARSHTFSAAGLVSIGVSNGSIIISGAAGTGSGIGLSAGTQSVSNGVVTMSNSNGVSWGLNAGVLTATVNPGPAAGIAAGAVPGTTQTTGSLVYSNSNGISFGLVTGAGAGTITGSIAVPSFAVSAGTTSSSLTGATFSNSNGVSWGLNAGTITASIAAVPIAVSGSNGSFAFSTLSMGNLNGLSHYTSNGSLVASYTVPVQTNQTMGLFGVSQTTQNTSGTVNATGMSFAGAGNVSVGLTNGSIVISGQTAAGLTTGGALFAGNTTGQSSSSTYVLTQLNISGAGIISAGWSSNSLIISAPASTSAALLSAGMSTGGNTLGTTGLASNQLVLAGGANITLSGSTNAGSMTISIAAGAGGGGTASLYAVSNTTQSTSGSQAVSALSFNGAGAISLGISNGSIVVSGPATSSISATGNASISTNGATISIGANACANSIGGNSTSAGAGYSNISTGTAVFMGGPNITLSQNGASISISAGGGGAFSAQGGSSTFGTLNFTNSNGVSFSNTNGSVWASIAAQTNQTLSVAMVSQSTGNTSGMSVDARSLSFGGYGGVSAGLSTSAGGSTVLISGPATSSLIGTGMMSISSNASTISLGALLNVSGGAGTSTGLTGITFANSNGITFGLSTGASAGTMTASYNSTQFVGTQTSTGSTTGGMAFSHNSAGLSISNPYRTRYIYPDGNALNTIGAHGNATMSFQYVDINMPVSGTRLDVLMSQSYSTSAGAGTQTFQYSAYGIIYTVNGSTLSSLSSGSTQTTLTMASNTAGQTQLSQAAIRPISIPMNFNMPAGEYIVGVNVITANTAGSASFSVMGATMTGGQNYAEMSAQTATSQIIYSGMGLWSAATTGIVTRASISGINATGANLQSANVALVFRNA